MQEKGPYVVREYTQRYNVSSENNAVDFTERKFNKMIEGELNDVVVIANPAYRYVESLLSKHSDIASSSFEQGAVGLLSSWGLGRLRSRFGPIIKQATLPSFLTEAINALVASEYSGDASAARQCWRTSCVSG